MKKLMCLVMLIAIGFIFTGCNANYTAPVPTKNIKYNVGGCK